MLEDRGQRSDIRKKRTTEYRIWSVEYRRKSKFHHLKFLVRYSIFKIGEIDGLPGLEI